MADIDDLGKAKEEEYFLRKERELLNRLRSAATEVERRRQLGEALSGVDDEIVPLLAELGVADVLAVIHLVPLVQVAWADGQISAIERDKILGLARLRGLAQGSTGFVALEKILTTQPPASFFSTSLGIIRSLLAGNAQGAAQETQELEGLMTEIATSSGGILGFGSISPEERAAIRQVVGELSKERAEQVQQSIHPVV